MKKLLALLLALVMVLSLAACGGTEKKAEEKTEEPAQTETQAEEAESAQIGLGGDAYHPLDEKDMNRAGGSGDLDFSNLPPTQDKAKYLSDGRLQLTTGGLTLIFDIPFGWVVITQDAKSQPDDYKLATADPATVVSGLQKYGYCAAVFAPNKEQMMILVVQDDVALTVGDLNLMTDDDLDALYAMMLQSTPGLSGMDYAVLGDRLYMLLDFSSNGYVAIGTVMNNTSVYYLLPLTETLTEEAIDEFTDFIAAVEYK